MWSLVCPLLLLKPQPLQLSFSLLLLLHLSPLLGDPGLGLFLAGDDPPALLGLSSLIGVRLGTLFFLRVTGGLTIVNSLPVIILDNVRSGLSPLALTALDVVLRERWTGCLAAPLALLGSGVDVAKTGLGSSGLGS